MKPSRIIPAAIAALVLLVPAAGAPPVTPAHWTVASASAKPVPPSGTFALTLTAQIEPGWHLYALEEPEGGPVPTEIGLAQGDPLTLLDVREPEPRKIPDPVTHSLAGLFQNTVRFTLQVRAPHTRPGSSAVSHILVRYQTCNDQVCLPPHTETVAMPLEGVLR